MQSIAPRPSPVPCPGSGEDGGPRPPAPGDELWSDDEAPDPADDTWPLDDGEQGDPWMEDREDASGSIAPWPVEPEDAPGPARADDLAPVEDGDVATDVAEAGSWPAGGAGGLRAIGLRERIAIDLAGRPVVSAFCDTGTSASVIRGRIVRLGGETGLELRSGTLLAPLTHEGAFVTLDLAIAGCALRAVRLRIDPGEGPADVTLGRDVLAGRFLVDAGEDAIDRGDP